LIALCLLALPLLQEEPDPVHAYVDALRIELAEGKVGLISEVMHLDDDQAEIFWNLYQDYERELFALGDRRLELMEEFREALRAQALTDELATDLAGRFFALQADRQALIQTYFGLYSESLSPLAAAQFTQLESRFNTMIDLLFAVDTPLISAAAMSAPGDTTAAGGLALDPLAEEGATLTRHRGALWVTVGLTLLSLGVFLRHLGSGKPARRWVPAAVCLVLALVASVLLW